MSRVWETSAHRGGNLLVLLAIADFADDSGFAYPSVATLARKARMSSRNVQYAVRDLVAAAELEVLRGKGPKGCNLFRVRTAEGGERTYSQGVKEPAAGGEAGFTRTVPRTVRRTAPGLRPLGNALARTVAEIGERSAS